MRIIYEQNKYQAVCFTKLVFWGSNRSKGKSNKSILKVIPNSGKKCVITIVTKSNKNLGCLIKGLIRSLKSFLGKIKILIMIKKQ